MGIYYKHDVQSFNPLEAEIMKTQSMPDCKVTALADNTMLQILVPEKYFIKLDPEIRTDKYGNINYSWDFKNETVSIKLDGSGIVHYYIYNNTGDIEYGKVPINELDSSKLGEFFK